MKSPFQIKHFIVSLIVALLLACQSSDKQPISINPQNMMVRIAALEIDPDQMSEYIDILTEEASASVQLEPGVICIFPMIESENPYSVRIIEIYADQSAYEAHLHTPHFKKYKTSTADMVESLKLIDMSSLDPATMSKIFSKVENVNQ